MRGAWLPALIGLLLPVLAHAQQAQLPANSAAPAKDHPAGSGESILVTARPLPPKEEIRALARAITPPTMANEPLPRFFESVCFGSQGLDRQTLIDIGNRLAMDADEAGLRLGGDGCNPNIVIFFVDGVEGEIKKLLQCRWWVFGYRTLSEIREIVDERGPVRAWSNVETRSREGNRIGSGGFLHVSVASRIASPIRQDALASVVLVERKAIIGKTPVQIADYIAMRTLAGVRPRRTSGGETILTLFDGATRSAPLALTAFDRGYLHGLYAGEANALASTTQGKIVHDILKAKDRETSSATGK